MEGRYIGNVEVKTKDFSQKCTSTYIISRISYSKQVPKRTVQDLVNLNLMRHAGIGRGKHHITDAFSNGSKCVSKIVKDRSQLLKKLNTPAAATSYSVDKNFHCPASEKALRLVCHKESRNSSANSLCNSSSKKLLTIIRRIVLKTAPTTDIAFKNYIESFKLGQSHITAVHFCGCYSSLYANFQTENVLFSAMENLIKHDGDKTESASSPDLKIVHSSEEKSVLLISCKDNITVPVLHDEVCLKHTEEKTRSILEVGSNPSSLAPKISGGSQFDVNGNRVPEVPKIENKIKYSSSSVSVPSTRFATSPPKQCELLQKPEKNICGQSSIAKECSAVGNNNSSVTPVSENCCCPKLQGTSLKKRSVAFEGEKEIDINTLPSVKRKPQYKSARPENIRCIESVFPSLENSVSVEKLFKGLGNTQCPKKLNIESCNLSKSPLGVEAICDNYSESDIVASDTVNKMMFFPALPSSHCVQQRKPDSSRFKTANDMSSENSSSSNSDLENLNSVPTNRKNNVQHATSYPSQVLSTPQASYADVIRTPAAAVSKTHPPQGVNSIFPENSLSKASESNIQPPVENNSAEKVQKKEEAHPMGSSEWIISRLSQLDVNTNAALNVNGVSPHSTPNGLDFVNPQPIAVSLEKPSFYHSGLQTNKNAPYSMSLSPVNLCSPNKVNENRGLTDCNTEKLPISKANERMAVQSASSHSVIGLGELSSQKLEGPANGRTDSLSSNPSSMSSSICDAFKYASSSNGDNADSKSKQPPVVIMDNFMPLENTSGISFGIDFDEVVQLCSDSNTLSNSVPFCEHPAIQDSDKSSICNENCTKTVESAEKQCMCVAGSDNFVCDEHICKKRAIIVDCSTNSTSRVTVAGKNLYWKDVEVNNTCDISSLVGFLSETWNAIENSIQKGSSNPDAKIKYFEPENL